MPTAGGGGIVPRAIMADGPVAYWRVGEATARPRPSTRSAADRAPTPARVALGQPAARSSRRPGHGGRLRRHDGLPPLGNDVVDDWPVGNGAFSIELWSSARPRRRHDLKQVARSPTRAYFRRATSGLHIEKVDSAGDGRSRPRPPTRLAPPGDRRRERGDSGEFCTRTAVDVTANVNNTTTFGDHGERAAGDRPPAGDRPVLRARSTSSPSTARCCPPRRSPRTTPPGPAAPVAAAAAAERSGHARRRAPAPRPGHGRGRWPTTRTRPRPTRTRAGSSPTASGTPSGSRSDPGTSELWLGDVGWDAWEEINLIANPAAGVDRLRLAVLRGHGTPSQLRQPRRRHLRDALCGGSGRGDVALLHVQPQRDGRPGRDVPDRERLVDLGPRVLHRRQLPGELHGGLFFSRLHARLHLVHARAGQRAPEHGPDQHVRRLRGQPGLPDDRPGRRPGLRRLSTAARSTGSRSAGEGATSRRPRSPSANPTSGPAPLAVAFSGTASTDPELGRADLRLGLRWQRDRRRDDGDRQLHLHDSGHLRRAAPRDRPGRAVRQQDGHDQRQQHAAGPDDHERRRRP